jgi:hypothetical protein
MLSSEAPPTIGWPADEATITSKGTLGSTPALAGAAQTKPGSANGSIPFHDHLV